jgi:hypothetical protein
MPKVHWKWDIGLAQAMLTPNNGDGTDTCITLASMAVPAHSKSGQPGSEIEPFYEHHHDRVS